MRYVIALVSALLCPSLTWAAAGQVESASGDVWAIRGQQTLPLVSGTVVQASDVIWTGKTGQVRLVMRDDSVVFLGPRSRMRIERYEMDQQGGGLLAGAFYLLWGKARFLVTKLKQASSSFSVSTQTANIGVRGTEFGVIVPPPDITGQRSPTTDALLFKGAIVGRGLKGGMVAMTPGQFAHFTVSEPPREREITANDIERLGIHALAPGLVEPKPMRPTAKPGNPDGAQAQAPGILVQPNTQHPAPANAQHAMQPPHPVHPPHPPKPPHPVHPPHPPKPPHPPHP